MLLQDKVVRRSKVEDHGDHGEVKLRKKLLGSANTLTVSPPIFSNAFSHCVTLAACALPQQVSIMRQEAQFHPRRVEDIPSTPSTFPRNCWLSWEAFGFPPFGHYQYHYQACWAAREASKTWSRVLGKPTEVDCEGTVLADRKKAERPDETIDDTCFMLAVFDKVFEA